jgi:hypothetical protein
MEPQWAQFFKGIRKELKKAKPKPGLAAAAIAVLSLVCLTYGFPLYYCPIIKYDKD